MNRCPAFDCDAPIGEDQVACKAHWFLLPKPLRERIWHLYRTQQGSDAHRTAVFDAIAVLASVPTLPALSVLQPWAWALAEGFKTIENRTWSTKYRGWFAVHASAKKPNRLDVEEVEFLASSQAHPQKFAGDTTDFGHVLGVVYLSDCVPLSEVTNLEKPWSFGPWCWRVFGAQKLAKPVKMRGALGLFRMTDADAAAVRAQVNIPPATAPSSYQVQGVSVERAEVAKALA